MRYRLKSDPSVEIISETTNGPFDFGDSTRWEVVRKPAQPVLVEDELDELQAEYPMSAASTDLLTRTAAELRRLRKEATNNAAAWATEETAMFHRLQILTQQRDKAQRALWNLEQGRPSPDQDNTRPTPS